MHKAAALKVLTQIERRVSAEISLLARSGSGSIYAAGLAAEGYDGGYRDALQDVALLLRDVWPSRRDYWPDELRPTQILR